MNDHICGIVKNMCTNENIPGSASIGAALAELTIINVACEAAPNLTQPAQSSMRDGAPLEHRLSELAGKSEAWRDHPLYPVLMAQKLGAITVGSEDSIAVVSKRLQQLEAVAAPDPEAIPPARTAELDRYIAHAAQYEALARVGLTGATGVRPALFAAYSFYRRDIGSPLDRAVDGQRARIDMARRQYLSHVDLTRVTETFEHVNRLSHLEAITVTHQRDSPANHWWKQLQRDLGAFRQAHIR